MDVYLKDIARFCDARAAQGKDPAEFFKNDCCGEVVSFLGNNVGNVLGDAMEVKDDDKVNRETVNDPGNKSSNTNNPAGKLPDNNFPFGKSPTEGHGEKERHIRRTLWFLLVVSVLLAADNVSSYSNEATKIWPTETYRLYSQVSYQALRFSRKLLQSLNLLSNYSLMGDCVIGNPFFRSQSRCARCLAIEGLRGQTRVTNLTQMDFLRDSLIAPIILKNSSSGVTLDRLRRSLTENLGDLEPHDGQRFLSNVLDIQHVQDLADQHHIDRLEEDTDAVIMWITKQQPLIKVLKSLFPKPKDLSGDLYHLSNQMVLIIFGRDANYKWKSMPTKLMYTQGLGSTAMILKPHRKCFDGCEPFTIQLDRGDVVVYDAMVWNLELTLVTNSTSAISVGLLGRVVGSLK